MLPFVNAPNPTTPRVTLLLSYANRAVAWMDRVARHKILMCLLAMATVMVIRIVLLPWIPIPKPYIADEFSYQRQDQRDKALHWQQTISDAQRTRRLPRSDEQSEQRGLRAIQPSY